MKYKILPHQLKLLNQNFILIEEGPISLNENLIRESGMREYLVSFWVSSYNAEIRIGTHGGSGMAMSIARKLFPSANVYSAKSA